MGDARPVASGEEAFIANPAVSADGRRAIVDRFDSTTSSADLWMLDLGGGTGARLTFTARGQMDETALFSPDGERVALTGIDDGGVTRPWIQPTGGGTKDGLLPDSDKVFIYQSAESGRPEVYVTNYPTATAKWQVSTEGGSKPSWSADGRQLYYLAGDRVVAAAVHDGASFSAGAARGVEVLGDRIVDFSVARSGPVVAVREIDPGKPPLTIVRNWDRWSRRSAVTSWPCPPGPGPRLPSRR